MRKMKVVREILRGGQDIEDRLQTVRLEFEIEETPLSHRPG